MKPRDTHPLIDTPRPDMAADGSGARILVVEDDALTAMALLTQLRTLGYEIAGQESTGEVAIERAAELRPDLVLMDINLAGEMDGTEAADRIHRQYHLPVVYLSGQSSEEIIERAKVTEAYGYVLKPYDDRALKIAVEMALSKHRNDREREEAEARLLELASTDALTGLKNRRAFEEAIASEFERARRYGTPLSLLMIDIDHFKRLNDSLGHLAGDAVLHRVAQIIRTAARASDFVARFGGEEFAVLLIQADQETAVPIAERLRREIEAEDWQGQRITVTVGVASVTPALRDATDLIATADAALYRGKARGRNRVVRHANLA